MTQQIEIESIARLDVKPGETLVVNLGNRLITVEQRNQIADTVRQHMPEGVEVLITIGDVELKVIGKDSA